MGKYYEIVHSKGGDLDCQDCCFGKNGICEADEKYNNQCNKWNVWKECEGKKIDAGESNCTLYGVIHWAFFPEQTPNFGDQIILAYPPEQMTEPIITIYDRNTEWIDGCKYAVITPCV